MLATSQTASSIVAAAAAAAIAARLATTTHLAPVPKQRSPTKPPAPLPQELYAEAETVARLFTSNTAPIQGIGDLLLAKVTSVPNSSETLEEDGAIGPDDLSAEGLARGLDGLADRAYLPPSLMEQSTPLAPAPAPAVAAVAPLPLQRYRSAPTPNPVPLELLSQPLPSHECLTKANSAMLQMGLTFSLMLDARADTLQHGGCRRATIDPLREAMESDTDRRLRLPLDRREEMLQRHNDLLQERIDKRDNRRHLAVEGLTQSRRAMADGMRTAMWRTLTTLTLWSFWDIHRLQADYERLRLLFLPVWRRHRFAKHRRILQRFLTGLYRTRNRLERPKTSRLRACGKLFQGWPEDLLATFISRLRAVVFCPRQAICHQGDPSHVLYILMDGTVDVVVRPSNQKARGRSGRVVATLQPMAYFGEYGVFADEPRAGSVIGVKRVLAWACSKEMFVYFLRRLPSPIFKHINQHFEASMSLIYRVHHSHLEGTVLFRGWDAPVLEELVRRLVPVCFPEGSVIFQAGAPGICLYFVCRGVYESVGVNEQGRAVVRAAANTREPLGVRACIFPEPHSHRVTALTTIQAWRLDKSLLMGYMLERPSHFLATKQRVNEQCAALLARPPPAFFAAIPFFAKLPEATLTQVYCQLVPQVVEPYAVLSRAGGPITSVLVLVEGSCQHGSARYGVGDAVGADLILDGAVRWPNDVTTMERLAGWAVDLAVVAAALRQPSFRRPAPRHGDGGLLLRQLQHLLETRDP
jgi:CRP-like cAMP-binding protein